MLNLLCRKRGLFLRTLPDNKLHDLNFSYSLCQNIADYLSKYMAKKIENNGNGKNENKKSMQQNVLKQVFFDFPVFVNNFGERYKKTVDMSNSGWVNANPGVVAMAQYLGKISSPDESCVGCGNAVASSGAIKKHRPRIGHVDVAAYIATQRQK